MSRENPAGPAEERAKDWGALADQAREAWSRFRESRLYVQVAMALGLVALTALVAVLPVGPVGRLRDGLAWTAMQDYDFQGLYRRADGWARERGGWQSAAQSSFASVTGRVQHWVDTITGPFGGTVTEQPKTPETDTGTGRLGTVMPVQGAVAFGFGWVSRNQAAVHSGVDLAAREGTEVVAIADGTVRRVGGDTAMGTFVEVDHGFGVAIYGQIHQLKVKAGDKVKQGQVLAVVAKPTGREGTGDAHLHLEVWVGGKAVEPVQFLPPGAPQGGSQT